MGFSLLDHAHNGIHQNHSQNNRRIADLPQKHGNGGCNKEDKDQWIIQLLKKGFHQGFVMAVFQNILPPKSLLRGCLLLHALFVLS